MERPLACQRARDDVPASFNGSPAMNADVVDSAGSHSGSRPQAGTSTWAAVAVCAIAFIRLGGALARAGEQDHERIAAHPARAPGDFPSREPRGPECAARYPRLPRWSGAGAHATDAEVRHVTTGCRVAVVNAAA